MPEPLPSHVKVKLSSDLIDFGNSKLHGQDTLIFIVDLETETVVSLKEKVEARLDRSYGSIRLAHVDLPLDALLIDEGVRSGDSFYYTYWDH